MSEIPPIGIVEGKKPHIERMFDSIAPRYDLLNRILSGGIDQQWRRVVMREVLDVQPRRLLDVATGTADLALMAARKGVPKVIGVDISNEMLEVGRNKVRKGSLNEKVSLENGTRRSCPSRIVSLMWPRSLLASGILKTWVKVCARYAGYFVPVGNSLFLNSAGRQLSRSSSFMPFMASSSCLGSVASSRVIPQRIPICQSPLPSFLRERNSWAG